MLSNSPRRETHAHAAHDDIEKLLKQDIDYANVNGIIDALRKKSYEFIGQEIIGGEE